MTYLPTMWRNSANGNENPHDLLLLLFRFFLFSLAPYSQLYPRILFGFLALADSYGNNRVESLTPDSPAWGSRLFVQSNFALKLLFNRSLYRCSVHPNLLPCPRARSLAYSRYWLSSCKKSLFPHHRALFAPRGPREARPFNRFFLTNCYDNRKMQLHERVQSRLTTEYIRQTPHLEREDIIYVPVWVGPHT